MSTIVDIRSLKVNHEYRYAPLDDGNTGWFKYDRD